MKKEDIVILGQLLASMKDAVGELEKAQDEGDMEKLSSAKKEIMKFQKKIGEIL